MARESVDWATFRERIDSLARLIREDRFAPDILVAVARGGLVPARMLSTALGVKRVASIGLEYADARREELRTYSGLVINTSCERALVIEDCLESGKALEVAVQATRQIIPDVRTAALYFLAKTQVPPSYSLGQIAEPPRFPWE